MSKGSEDMMTEPIEKSPFVITDGRLTPPCWEPWQMLYRTPLISIKTRVHGKHFCHWQYGSIFILFHIVVSECEAKRNLIKPTHKTDFDLKWHPKVTHFRVIRKLSRHFMMLRNNISFSSKGCEDIVSKSVKNCAKATFSQLMMWLYFFLYFHAELQKMHN